MRLVLTASVLYGQQTTFRKFRILSVVYCIYKPF